MGNMVYLKNVVTLALDTSKCNGRNCPAGAVNVQTGVGCAAAVINSLLGRNGGECCCGPQTDDAGSGGNGVCCG